MRGVAPQEPSKPRDVPIASGSGSADAAGASSGHGDFGNQMAGPVLDAGVVLPINLSISDMSYMPRPPRLPLPIEEELHTPGSPLLPAAEGGDEVEDIEGVLDPRRDEQDQRVAEDDADDQPDFRRMGSSSDAMTRKSSAHSTATTEDEESDEHDNAQKPMRATVPIRLDWLRGGDKIYVTGSMFQWNRKHRLQPQERKPGHFSATINMIPGTHHLRFLVDGTMTTSPDLPTTVDLGNNLVNFIDISADDVPRRPATTAATDSSKVAPVQEKVPEEKPKGRPTRPAADYTTDVPQYLLDFDQEESSPAYQHALQALDKLPSPPSLPGFLGKPILNNSQIRPEDNSVLIMPPNHTILNHLATSSIRNEMVAVSATTRYKNKVRAVLTRVGCC